MQRFKVFVAFFMEKGGDLKLFQQEPTGYYLNKSDNYQERQFRKSITDGARRKCPWGAK